MSADITNNKIQQKDSTSEEEILEESLCSNVKQPIAIQIDEKLEEDVFKAIMLEQGIDLMKHPTGIPRFHHKTPRCDDTLRHKLREEARCHFMKERSAQLLTNSEFRDLYTLLKEKSTNCDKLNLSTSEDTLFVTYQAYKELINEVDDKIKPYLTRSLFAKLQEGDPEGRVSIMSLYVYIMRKFWIQQTRIGLSMCDNEGLGYLRDIDLESFIYDLIPTLKCLECLEKEMLDMYVCIAARKFFFFLDTQRVGRVRILDVLACSFLEDLMELRSNDDDDLNESNQRKLKKNWFSASSALKVYWNFLKLDTDENGLLSINELAGYGSGTLTQPFLKRVFESCITYKHELDFRAYLDLVLALEHRSEPQALTFLFRILDLNGCGYLDSFVLNYFFRGIDEKLRQSSNEIVQFQDFNDQLFDMVKPRHPERITLNDLIACGCGDTFVSILIEFQAFWSYEYREVFSSDVTLPLKI